MTTALQALANGCMYWTPWISDGAPVGRQQWRAGLCYPDSAAPDTVVLGWRTGALPNEQAIYCVITCVPLSFSLLERLIAIDARGVPETISAELWESLCVQLREAWSRRVDPATGLARGPRKKVKEPK